MRRCLLLPLLFVILAPLRAQQLQGAYWYFGEQAGLNFNQAPPEVLFDSQAPKSWINALATMSSPEGELLFYSMGGMVWNRLHEPMPTAEIPPNSIGAQSLAIEHPTLPDRYVMVYTRGVPTNLLTYQIDMSLEGGLGAVVPGSYDTLQTAVSPLLSVMQHPNGQDYWVVSHSSGGSTYYARPLTGAGFGEPVLSTVGTPFVAGNGDQYMKSSPNSERAAYFAIGTPDSGVYSLVELFDFDRATGQLTERFGLLFTSYPLLEFIRRGSFSPNSDLLYVATDNVMRQYDLTLGDSAAVVGNRYEMTLPDSVIIVEDMQLAINGKIYFIPNTDIEGGVSGDRLGVINYPNQVGEACGVEPFAVDLLGRDAGGTLPALNQTLFRNSNTLQALAAPDTVCQGDTTVLSAFGAGLDTFVWSPTAGLSDPAGANPLAAPAQTTTYTVVGSNPFRTDTAQLTVVVVPAPQPTLPDTVYLCPPVALTLDATPPGGVPPSGGGPFTYAWTTGDTTTTLSVDSAGVYAVTVSNGVCERQDSAVVLSGDAPAPRPLEGPTTVCPGQAVSYSIALEEGETVAFLATGGTVVSQTDGTASVAWQQVGFGGLQAVVTSAFGCVGDTLSLPVSVSDLLLPQIGSEQADTLCQGSVVTYTATGVYPATSYVWQASGGTIEQGQGSAQVSVRWTAAGAQSLSLQVFDTTATDTCFGAAAPLGVEVLPLPPDTLPLVGALSFCASDSLQVYSVALPEGIEAVWSAVGGQIEQGQGSGQVSVRWQPAAPDHRLSLQLSTAAGCTGDALVWPIAVRTVPALSAAPYASFLCPGQLAGQTYAVATPVDTLAYDWTVTGGTLVAQQGGQVTVDWQANAAAYALSVVASTPFGCVSDTLRYGFVYDGTAPVLTRVSVGEQNAEAVEVDFALRDAQALPAALLTLERQTDGGRHSGGWQAVAELPADQTTYTDADVRPAEAVYFYRLSVVNGCGETLRTRALPTIRLQGQADEVAGRVALDWNAYLTATRYEVVRSVNGGPFDFLAAVGTDTSYRSGPLAAAGFEQAFRVVGYPAGGGPDDAPVYSSVWGAAFENALDIPNVITPNGDGVNEVWVIERIEAYAQRRVVLYDRWGAEVWRSGAYGNDWRGQDAGGSAVPAGVYYYRLVTERGEYRGWVQVLR